MRIELSCRETCPHKQGDKFPCTAVVRGEPCKKLRRQINSVFSSHPTIITTYRDITDIYMETGRGKQKVGILTNGVVIPKLQEAVSN